MARQIALERFTDELYELLEETFERVQGMYLDRGTSLFETLETISAAEASRPVSARCASIAAQVEHVDFYLRVMADLMRGEAVGTIDWGASWRRGNVTPEEWDALRGRLSATYRDVLAVMRGFDTWERGDEIGGALNILVHTAHHLGEIRQALCTVQGEVTAIHAALDEGMVHDAMKLRIIEPGIAGEPEIGRWLWALEDARRRTKEVLATLAPAALDWTPPGGSNSIGALLYHIALIEADYLYSDVLGRDEPPAAIAALFPYADRDGGGVLTAPPAMGLDEHLARLDAVRAELLATFTAMTAGDFRRPHALPQYGYTITPEWTLHHLMQHEAEHRGQIMTLRDFAGRATVGRH